MAVISQWRKETMRATLKTFKKTIIDADKASKAKLVQKVRIRTYVSDGMGKYASNYNCMIDILEPPVLGGGLPNLWQRIAIFKCNLHVATHHPYQKWVGPTIY